MHFSTSLLAVLSFALATAGLPSQLGERAADAADPAWIQQVVSQHNAYRRQYGAPDLTWNDGLYTGTLQWATACNFAHSGGAYGENLAAGTASDYGLTSGLTGWMNEASLYDYNNPGFSDATGHFTQVVWKSTTQVACALANCPAGTIFGQASHYLVCRYTPPGNVIGQFPQNVGRHQ